MTRALYPRLAANNLRKNGSTYFPYMLTSVCSIITFYAMLSITDNPGIASMPGSEPLKAILTLGNVVIGLFSAVLLFYTNGFLIKRRKKELGLYSILGMEKKHMIRVLFYETLITAAVSLIVGLFGGVLISRLFFLILVNITQLDTPIAFHVSMPAISTCAAVFGLVFLLTLATDFRQIHLSNPIALLRGSQTGEKEPKASWLLTLIGVCALGGGYAIAQLVQSPLDALLLFFLAVILVIIGTYCLFTSGSIAVLKLLKRCKGYYYKPRNFIAVSGMIYRMKQNAVGLANICILSTMVLVTISTTVALYIGQEKVLRNQYPRDISITVAGGEAELEAVAAESQALAGTHGVKLVKPLSYQAIRLMGVRQGNTFVGEKPANMTNNDIEQICMIKLVPLADYNRLTGGHETLGPDEMLLFSDSRSYEDPTLILGERRFRVKRVLDTLPMAAKLTSSLQATYHLIVPDLADMSYVSEQFIGQNQGTVLNLYETDLAGSQTDILAYTEALEAQVGRAHQDVSISSLHAGRQQWLSMFGGFLFIGIFLGLMFMMAMVLIIYYKQISEGYDDRGRFEILQKVGMGRAEVKGTIRRQILMVFFLPLIVATVHILFAFRVICKLLSIFYLTDTGLILLCTGATLLFFGLLYALTYTLTAKTYYRLVQN